jgi:type II secretory pathway pseudopilin PulG
MTLAEVMVGMVILSLAILFFLDLLMQSTRIERKARYAQIATQIAQQYAEWAQHGAFTQLLLDQTTQQAVPQLPNGQLTLTCSALDGNAANRAIRQVQVTVSWSETTGTMTRGAATQTVLVAVRR